MTDYGAAFDRAVERWAVLADEHERVHREGLADCGGVGGCTLAAGTFDRFTDAKDALDEWRRRR